MIRTQIQLTEQQAEALQKLAKSRGVSMASVIRETVDELITRNPQPSDAEKRERAKNIAGAFNSGVTDLGKNHDKYLAEIYK